jgi:hypothetical protein
MSFDRYIGVDWSGARGPKLRGLQVAVCEAGTAAPALVDNPDGTVWSRHDFLNWLGGQLNGKGRTLCGLDFSFCFPWCDADAYFPPGYQDPAGWQEFWHLVDVVCAPDEDYFGGRMADDARFSTHFAVNGVVGNDYRRRLRVTEIECQAQSLGAPESVFNLRGARQVGKGSLAGMRMLRALQTRATVSVWPFDEVSPTKSVVVETFPTAFVRLAGMGPGKVRNTDSLVKVLRHYGSAAPEAMPDMTDDQSDALISAAALRCLAADSDLWHPEELSDRVRRYEGWTFGVR